MPVCVAAAGGGGGGGRSKGNLRDEDKSSGRLFVVRRGERKPYTASSRGNWEGDLICENIVTGTDGWMDTERFCLCHGNNSAADKDNDRAGRETLRGGKKTCYVVGNLLRITLL